MKPETKIQSRVWELVTKQETISQSKILEILQNHNMIKRYAFILHDKDVITQDAVGKATKHYSKEYIKNKIKDISESEYIQKQLEQHGKILGKNKDSHWHIVIEGKDNISLSQLANWFGIAPNFFEKKTTYRGAKRNAFLDSVRYLTHEETKQQVLGKHRYADTEITSNFDFRSELTKEENERETYGRTLNEDERMLMAVRYDGLTLHQAQKENKMLYAKNESKYQKARLNYISDMRPPIQRLNFYICGNGGVGKGLMSRAIARSLFPDFDNDEDIFFETGAKGVPFEGYDGQPVIIWNDRRAIDLLQELGSRANVFNVLDTHPTKQKQNVKYASINLCNEVNIINSVQPWDEFLDALAGEYTDRQGDKHKSEDKGQAYRRMPFIIPLHEDDFDLFVNRGFSENTTNYTEYIQYNHIRGNMQHIAVVCGGNLPLRREIEQQTVTPIIAQANSIKSSTYQCNEDNVRDLFSSYGKTYNPDTTDGQIYTQWFETQKGVLLAESQAQ